MSEESCNLSEDETRELKRIFFAQAHEIADELQDVLMRVESGAAANDDELRVLKRFLHTLKGDATSMGYAGLGRLCHRLEDAVAAFATLDDERRREWLGILFAGVDEIKRLLGECEAGREAAAGQELLDRIERFGSGAAVRQQPPSAPLTEYQQLQIDDARERGMHPYGLVVRFHPECREREVAALMLSERLAPVSQIVRTVPEIGSEAGGRAEEMTLLVCSALEPEELRSEALLAGITVGAEVRPWQGEGAPRTAAPAAAARAASGDAAPPAALPSESTQSEMLRVDAAKVDRVLDLVGELIIGRSMLDQVARESERDGGGAAELAARLLAVNSYLERTVSDLHKSVRTLRMVQVRSLFRKFPRMVRDLAHTCGKRIRVEIHGEGTELDKGIVDALGEPLTHLIRNLVDHGVGSPEQRRAAGKPEEGTVTLRAYHEAAQIVIEATDDGRGIDTEKLKRKAVAMGLLGQAEAQKLSATDAQRLLFLPGLTTAETISETSGRGVGMDAVKTAVEAMKGSIEIVSTPGRGTTFRLRLPITLAVIKALLFEVGPRLYAIPVAAIAEVARIVAEELQTVDGRPVLRWRDRVLSVLDLRPLFRIDGGGGGKKFVLIVNVGARRVGLLIDRLLWQQELVVKALDDRYLHSDLIAGASILGDGKVVLILDAAALVTRAIEVERGRLVAP